MRTPTWLNGWVWGLLLFSSVNVSVWLWLGLSALYVLLATWFWRTCNKQDERRLPDRSWP
jgi:hypothetical protein